MSNKRAKNDKATQEAKATYALMCAASNRAVSAANSLKKPKSKTAQAAYALDCAAYDEALKALNRQD